MDTNASDTLETYANNLASENEDLGALQRRLQAAFGAQSSTQESLVVAESRIVDADVASEATEARRAQIQNQITAALLAQANIQPQVALLLLDREPEERRRLGV